MPLLEVSINHCYQFLSPSYTRKFGYSGAFERHKCFSRGKSQVMVGGFQGTQAHSTCVLRQLVNKNISPKGQQYSDFLCNIDVINPLNICFSTILRLGVQEALQDFLDCARSGCLTQRKLQKCQHAKCTWWLNATAQSLSLKVY